MKNSHCQTLFPRILCKNIENKTEVEKSQFKLTKLTNLPFSISGRSRISRRGCVDPLRGACTSDMGIFWLKCMPKQKNWVRYGGRAPGTAPLDPPMPVVVL